MQANLSGIVNPPAPDSRPTVPVQARNPSSEPKPTAARPATASVPEIVTNVLVVSRFSEVPLEALHDRNLHDFSLTAHHWMEGKMLLDFQYLTFVDSFDTKGAWSGTTSPTIAGIAIFAPEEERWVIIRGSEVDFAAQNNFYHHSALWRGDVYTCGADRSADMISIPNSGRFWRFRMAPITNYLSPTNMRGEWNNGF